MIIQRPLNRFPDFFCTGISNCCRLLKIQYIIAIHLMRWLTNFYNFRFKWTATAAIGIHPTKAWLSQLVNFINAIWIWEHFRRMICNKIVLNLEKMPQKCMECFSLHLEHLAWIEHQFLSCIRDSRKAGSLWGMMRDVGGVRKSEHQSWLANHMSIETISAQFDVSVGTVLYFDLRPSPKILFQGDTPEGSDTFQWPVIERDRVGGLRLMIWDKVKVLLCHYSDAPEESNLWTAWQLFPLDDD